EGAVEGGPGWGLAAERLALAVHAELIHGAPLSDACAAAGAVVATLPAGAGVPAASAIHAVRAPVRAGAAAHGLPIRAGARPVLADQSVATDVSAPAAIGGVGLRIGAPAVAAGPQGAALRRWTVRGARALQKPVAGLTGRTPRIVRRAHPAGADAAAAAARALGERPAPEGAGIALLAGAAQTRDR